MCSTSITRACSTGSNVIVTIVEVTVITVEAVTVVEITIITIEEVTVVLGRQMMMVLKTLVVMISMMALASHYDEYHVGEGCGARELLAAIVVNRKWLITKCCKPFYQLFFSKGPHF